MHIVIVAAGDTGDARRISFDCLTSHFYIGRCRGTFRQKPFALVRQLKIPCSKLQGIFNHKECGLFRIRSLLRFNNWTPQTACHGHEKVVEFFVQKRFGQGRVELFPQSRNWLMTAPRPESSGAGLILT